MAKLVYGIGFKGNKYAAVVNKKAVKEYALWIHMLQRCTNKDWIRNPSYIGTTCSENFKSYSYFYEWCQEQVGFKNTDEKGNAWQIDKDLLVKGNKVYSEDTCVFVPHNINSLLTNHYAKRGCFPVGVSLHTDSFKYRARCCIGFGRQVHLGLYNTPEDAFMGYKKFKEDYIKQVAEQYKNYIDCRAYSALLDYVVEETD